MRNKTGNISGRLFSRAFLTISQIFRFFEYIGSEGSHVFFQLIGFSPVTFRLAFSKNKLKKISLKKKTAIK